MLEKLRELKDLAGMKDDLHTVMERQQQAIQELDLLHQAIQTAKTKIEELQKTQTVFASQFNEQLHTIKALRDDFKAVGTEVEKELHTFHLLKSELQKKIVKEAEEKITQLIQDIREKTDPYKELESRAKELGQQFQQATKELEKFQAISKTINEKDFELVKFGKMLEHNDQEKLDLMKRIDALERLLAAMKRGGRERTPPPLLRKREKDREHKNKE